MEGERGKGKGEGEVKGGGGGVYVARLNFHILGRRQWKPNGISLLYLRFPSSLSQFQPMMYLTCFLLHLEIHLLSSV